jgi:hypothetical protein
MRYLIILFSLLLSTAVFAQSDATFPASWTGKWAGRLEIFSPKGKQQEIPMELHIEPIDSAHYSWKIIYGEDKEEGLRSYILKTVDPETGRYVIDEQNTILLDAILISGKLYSRFEVMGNLLLSTTQLINDELHYEIISGKLDPLTTSGGEVHEGEDIPEVHAYPVVVRQFAILRRQ